MSTIEDFENAPVGATATHADGSRAMKMGDVERRWIFPSGRHTDDEEMAEEGYTLDQSAPATAREALDLAWELAHPVKEGQVIPKGTRYLEDQGSGLKENRARYDFNISLGTAPHIRTLEPLPDPEPDWLDAPAVLASLDGWHRDQRVVFLPTDSNDRWVRPGTGSTFHWNELRDVTPLYPKGQEA